MRRRASPQIVLECYGLHLQRPQLSTELKIPQQTKVIDEIGRGPLDRKKAAAIDLAGRRADLHLRIDTQRKSAPKFLPGQRLPGSNFGDAETVGVRESHTPLLQKALGEVRHPPGGSS